MLEAAQRPENSSIEVAVISEKQHCVEVADIQKAELAPGTSLLSCLGVRGQLVLWDPTVGQTSPAQVEGCYGDFSWEEVTVHSQGVSSFRLLAVGSQCDLKLLEVEGERSAPVSLLCVAEYPADYLLQIIREQDHGVCELQSVHVLSFAAGCCCLLLNCAWLLQLQWQQGEEEPQTLSCCRIQLTDNDKHAAVHHCVCRETLFILSSTGLISVYNVTDGSLLASIDLPTYLSSRLAEAELTSSSLSFSFSSSFSLIQVSSDLSTAVAVTQSNTAIAVDLNHYFRMYPDHLLCAVSQSRPPLLPQQPRDQDNLSSSSLSLGTLRSTFSTDRSWEARLASMYNRAQRPTTSFSSPAQPAGASWSSSLPHLESHSGLSSAQSIVPPGGTIVAFSVPESSAASLLTVSEFSAMLTFTTPGNRHTTVALWDVKSGSVNYHQAEGDAAPVQCCGEKQHRLLLRKAGVFQVLFSVSQQDLLSRLMLFGSAATVDAVCHLNNWGRCSIPIHSLQAGLKNRQLDTVDFYLKSKENILNPSTAFSAAEPPAAATLSLTDSVQELCPALDLLCSTVRDSNSEAQSRQFSEQLLNITMGFVNTQIRSVLSSTSYEDSDVQNCVEILDQYVTELRSYMKRYPWSAGGDVFSTSTAAPAQEEALEDEWGQLSTEEVIHQSILTNQIPRAQAVLRNQNRPEQRLLALRMEGLQQVFSCLQSRDLQTAKTLLTNMGFSVRDQFHSICLHTDNREIRELMVEKLSSQRFFPEEEMQSFLFIREMEKLGSLPAFRCSANTSSQRVVWMFHKEGDGEEVMKELVGQTGPEEEGRLWRTLRLDWVRNWDQSCQTVIHLSRLQHTDLSSCDSSVLWRYLTVLHDHIRVVNWIQNRETSGACQWPELSSELVNNNTVCSTYMRENILDLLARYRS